MGAAMPPADPLQYSQFKRHDMRYEVHVPSAPYEGESTHDEGRAWDLCLDLSEEFGYAEVRRNGIILGSYSNGR